MNPLRTAILCFLFSVSTLAGCKSTPFEHTEFPALSSTNYAQRKADFRKGTTICPAPFSFSLESSLLFDYGFFQYTVLALCEIMPSSIHIAAFTPSGIKLFEVSGKRDGTLENLSSAEEKGWTKETPAHLLRDFSRIYPLLAQPVYHPGFATDAAGNAIPGRSETDDGTIITQTEIRFTKAGKATISDRFAGKALDRIEHTVEGVETDSRTRYYKYMETDQHLRVPLEIIHDSDVNPYRLVIRTSSVRKM